MSLIQREHSDKYVSSHVDTASEENRLCFSQPRASSTQTAGLWLLALLFGVYIPELQKVRAYRKGSASA